MRCAPVDRIAADKAAMLILPPVAARIAPVHREAVCVVEQVAYRSAGELTGQVQLPRNDRVVSAD
ncbi:MAG: hypothetical protein ACRDUW_18910 [Pseudonocardiaceae bacterium]